MMMNNLYPNESASDIALSLWISYWRSNLHRFASDLGLSLKLFQKILIYAIDMFPNFTYVASRGTGKSFLIALYAVLKCILYPDLIVTIASSTKAQAILMISQHIKFFMENYPLIANEIEGYSTSIKDPHVRFKNKSIIKVVPATENARGHRTHILIVEECFIVKESIIKTVLNKFGTTPRQPPYIHNPKYADIPVEPIREIFISSARTKAEWGWNHCQKMFNAMIKEMSLGVADTNNWYTAIFSSDWLMPMHFKLFDERKMRKSLELEGITADDMSWSMEMDSIWYGENEGSYFRYKWFEDSRELREAWMPFEHQLFASNKVPQRPSSKDGEFRVMSIDVASSPKKDADNTIIDIINAKETSKGYDRQVRYIKGLRGEKITEQALEIKRCWYDFGIEFIVLDILNIGRELYGLLTKETYDHERNITYPALICYNDEDYKAWAYDPNGIQCIYAFKGDKIINSDIARGLKNSLLLNQIKLLVKEAEHINDIVDQMETQGKNYIDLDSEEKFNLNYPYIQTTLTINEIMMLDHTAIGGIITIKELSGKTKDRYSALAMGNFFITRELETKYHKIDENQDTEIFII